MRRPRRPVAPGSARVRVFATKCATGCRSATPGAPPAATDSERLTARSRGGCAGFGERAEQSNGRPVQARIRAANGDLVQRADSCNAASARRREWIAGPTADACGCAAARSWPPAARGRTTRSAAAPRHAGRHRIAEASPLESDSPSAAKCFSSNTIVDLTPLAVTVDLIRIQARPRAARDPTCRTAAAAGRRMPPCPIHLAGLVTAIQLRSLFDRPSLFSARR